jgi:hypothetical protein
VALDADEVQLNTKKKQSFDKRVFPAQNYPFSPGFFPFSLNATLGKKNRTLLWNSLYHMMWVDFEKKKKGGREGKPRLQRVTNNKKGGNYCPGGGAQGRKCFSELPIGMWR